MKSYQMVYLSYWHTDWINGCWCDSNRHSFSIRQNRERHNRKNIRIPVITIKLLPYFFMLCNGENEYNDIYRVCRSIFRLHRFNFKSSVFHCCLFDEKKVLYLSDIECLFWFILLIFMCLYCPVFFCYFDRNIRINALHLHIQLWIECNLFNTWINKILII